MLGQAKGGDYLFVTDRQIKSRLQATHSQRRDGHYYFHYTPAGCRKRRELRLLGACHMQAWQGHGLLMLCSTTLHQLNRLFPAV
jgi:hypothetical protein